jgi:hypothetical protein
MEGQYKETFRGLPLTPDQQQEVMHYIHVCERAGMPWDTPELSLMLDEMLNPPEAADEGAGTVAECIAAERQVAENEEWDRTDLLKCERDRNH